MVASVTEGEDKPLKYPLMFRACELVILNKVDLLPHVDFDVSKWSERLETVHPGVAWMVGQRAHGRGRGRVPRLARRAAGAPHGGGVTQERTRANREFFTAESARLAAVCDEMAQRFVRGGRLLAVGEESDARHVAVEFVHPVIVGKRALPALALPASRAGAGGRGRRHRHALRGRPRARSCDEVFVPPTDDPFVAPGADRDALPRALGARARVPRSPRDVDGRRRRGGLPLSVPGSRDVRPRRGPRGRAPLDRGQGGGDRRAARADAAENDLGASPRT